MFPIRIHNILPVSKIILQSVAVRGALGPLTVWMSPVQQGTRFSVPMRQEAWTLVYSGFHKGDFKDYTTLSLNPSHRNCLLDTPLALAPGSICALYIHSSARGDEAIVYDNADTESSNDPLVHVGTAKAHLSPQVFGQTPIWGAGIAWRDRRSFVGCLSYGVIYKLFAQSHLPSFGPRFTRGVDTVRALRGPDWSRLPDECVEYILHLLPWHWFDDTVEDMKEQYRVNRQDEAVEEMPPAQVLQDDDDDNEDNHPEVLWEYANGYRANPRMLEYRYYTSDEETEHRPDPPLALFRRLGRRLVLRRRVQQLEESSSSSSDDEDFMDTNQDVDEMDEDDSSDEE